ncbi:MAG: HAD family hydrolase [Spirochaetia bacterium]|jgi:putative hydrolase of the HAD superfamily|nr:HAD family hydrolase [Spirochaetia bacterium]
MRSKHNIEAVVFDVDGTLYPNYKMYIISAFFFVLHPVLAPAFRRMRKKIRKMDNSGNFSERQALLLAQEMNITFEKADSLLKKYIYGQFISMFSWIKPYRILEEILYDLKANKLKLGIISDFPVKEKLSFLGLDHYWDEVCSADEMGMLKPAKKVFDIMAGRLGIPPEKIIYVGNHYLYDIMGANNAGMVSAHFSRFRKKNSAADFTFFDYRKLKAFVLDSVNI